jgi:hypothetical protein
MRYTILLASLFAAGLQATTTSLSTSLTLTGIPSGLNSSGPAYLVHNTYPRTTPPDVLWGTPGIPADAHYISAGDCGRDGYTASCDQGTYSFTTNFTLENSAAGLLQFQVAGDNQVEVYLNGSFLYHQGTSSGSTGWSSLSPVQTVTSGFTLGENATNILELRVLNSGGYTGGILVGGVSDTPEPVTFALCGIGLSLVALVRRKRQSGKHGVPATSRG